MIFPVKRAVDLGFEMLATGGTAEVLRRNGIQSTQVRKHREGAAPTASRPSSTSSSTARSTSSSTPRPAGRPRVDGYEIRAADDRGRQAVPHDGAAELGAAVQAIEAMRAVRG